MKKAVPHKRLGDLFVFKNGRAFKKGEWTTSGLPIIRIQNLNSKDAPFNYYAGEYNRDIFVERGDLLFSWSGTVGSSFGSHLWDREPGVLNQHIFKIGFKDDFDKRYAFHALRHITTAIEESVSGAVGLVHITKEKLNEFTLPVPPLAEQRRIVGILDEAFEGIATAKANAEKNLQNASALFESLLNAAVCGELTREWRREHPNAGIASEQLKKALSQRRSQWTGKGRYVEPQSPISHKPVDIPNCWALASPEQLATHIVDCPHSTPKWTESGVICLRTTNFKPACLDLASVRFVSPETYRERIARLEPMPGDILYSREGGILGIACTIPDGLKACLGQRMMQFRLDSNIALPPFFTAVLNSSMILSEVRRLTGGAASPHLNIRDIRAFPISLPPISEQHEIIAKLADVAEETQRLESIYQRKLAALDDLKKSLLHQAFSGNL